MDSVVHFEMPYDDRERMAKFYTKAFGWETKILGEEFGRYVLATTTETDAHQMIKKPGAINGGFFPKAHDSRNRYNPRIVIAVNNIEQAIQRVKDAGGVVDDPIMDIPGVGKYVFFTDTEGNNVSMLQSTAQM